MKRWTNIKINGEVTIYSISSEGDIMNDKTGELMKPGKNKKGYKQLSLTHKHKRYTFRVHRLVAIAFIPNPLNLPQVNHIDGNKLNNDVSNLEWASNLDNMRHSWKIGLRKAKKGEDVPNNIYPEEIIHKVCKLMEDGYKLVDIEKETGVHIGVIQQIKRKKLWKEVSDQYNIPECKKISKCEDFSNHWLVIDTLLESGLSGKEIRKIYPLDIKSTKYNDLLKRRKRKLKKKGKI